MNQAQNVWLQQKIKNRQKMHKRLFLYYYLIFYTIFPKLINLEADIFGWNCCCLNFFLSLLYTFLLKEIQEGGAK
jgi:hypothetical protein